MRLEWIQDILAVHDTGSLRAAADVRFLSPSAFTRRIKSVEDSIGNELFDRNNKPLKLRPHVVELIPDMRDAAANLISIQNELRGLGSEARTARLICQHTLSVSWAPKVAKELANNGIQQRIRSGSRDDCALSVLKNEADVALVYEDQGPKGNSDEDLFNRIRFCSEQFIPVAALKNHPELHESIKQNKFPLVSYPRNLFLGEMLQKALSTLSDGNLNFATVAESGLGPAVMEFVREGLGIGWLPESLIKIEIDNGDYTNMCEYLPSFSLDVVAICSKTSASGMKTVVWETIKNKFSVGRVN